MGFMGRVKKTIYKEGFTYRNTAHELKNAMFFHRKPYVFHGHLTYITRARRVQKG